MKPKAFESRLQALARANRQLTQSNWRGVALREIVRLEMEPFGGRTTMDGVDVILDQKQAQNFSLALHELATNAGKYGALSNGSGNVGISWTITANGETNILKFCWQERGGPAVNEPVQFGFGTALLKATFPGINLRYAPEGSICRWNCRSTTVQAMNCAVGRGVISGGIGSRFSAPIAAASSSRFRGLRPRCGLASQPRQSTLPNGYLE